MLFSLILCISRLRTNKHTEYIFNGFIFTNIIFVIYPSRDFYQHIAEHQSPISTTAIVSRYSNAIVKLSLK